MMFCALTPVVCRYDLAAALTVPMQRGPTFVKEKATRQSCDVTLPVDYRQPHPVVDILVRESAVGDTVVCHLAMLPAPNATEGAVDRTDGSVRDTCSSCVAR